MEGTPYWGGAYPLNPTTFKVMKHTVNEIHKFVMKNKTVAKMLFCEGSKLMYAIKMEGCVYSFPIDVSDRNEVGNTIFAIEEQASLLMRYVKKAADANELRFETEVVLDKRT